MKVLHINSYYESSPFYKELYEAQYRDGIEVSVFVPGNRKIKNQAFDYGPYTVLQPAYSPYQRFFFYWKQKSIERVMKKSIASSEYDVVHAHSLFTNGYQALNIKKKFQVPYVVAVRNTDLNFFFKKAVHLRRVGIEILSEAGAIVFLSPSQKTVLLETYVPSHLKESIQKKSFVIPNGLSPFWLHHAGVPKMISEGPWKILFVGNISANKNLPMLIKAVKILEDHGIQASLTAVGKLKEPTYIEKVPLKNFQYHEYMDKERLLDLYRASDLFVLPSKQETFGLVYLEAMSQGLPVLYTKGQGFDGHIPSGEVGFPVDAESAEDIAEKIQMAISSYTELSEKALKYVEAFQWENISATYRTRYEEILERKEVCDFEK